MSTSSSSSAATAAGAAAPTPAGLIDMRQQRRGRKKRPVKKKERVYMLLYPGGKLKRSAEQVSTKVRRRKYYGIAAERVKTTGGKFLWRVVFDDPIEDIEASPRAVTPVVNPFEAVMASDHASSSSSESEEDQESDKEDGEDEGEDVNAAGNAAGNAAAAVASGSNSPLAAASKKRKRKKKNNHHAEKRARADSELGKLAETVVESNGVPWTYITDCTDDYFPGIPGPPNSDLLGRARAGWADVDYIPDSLLDIWLKLYPGSIQEHCDRVNRAGERMTRQFNAGRAQNDNNLRKWKKVGRKRWLRFISIILAAALEDRTGRDELWSDPPKDEYGAGVNFSTLMSRADFEAIKKAAPWALANEADQNSDLWWMCRRGVFEYNRNRACTIQPGDAFLGDESMSAWSPTASATGGLPHLSYVERKPEPLGTEFKNICSELLGVLLFMEIQEGKDPMRAIMKAKHNMNPNRQGDNGQAAVAIRLTAGALGVHF